MIMKIIAILSLILVFWCHQSHHHIFMLITTNPLGLASEEFIPVSDVVSTSDSLSSTESPEAVAVELGSQSDKKSDETIPVVDTGVSDVPENVNNQNAQEIIEEIRHPDFVVNPASSEELDKSQVDGTATIALDSERIRNIDSESERNNLENLQDGTTGEANDLNFATDAVQANTLNLTSSAAFNESNQTVSHDSGNDSSLPQAEIPVIADDKTPSIPHSPQKEEEPIPSFMEWTQIQQKKLQESNLGLGSAGSGVQPPNQNGHKNSYSTTSQQNKSSPTGNQGTATKSRKEDNAKNFASPDCGAKVIQSNPELQNANGVLSSSKDEYMLNKCGIPIWFVVELCEPLKIEKVSLGNLELFSSSPKDIEIGISDRYPTRDWTKLGPFTLPDVRSIHSINLPATNASTFGKFLKVSILSHHGTEHFCPLSLVVVNGISEYEVLESENTHPEDIDTADKEESALYEEPVIDEQSTEGNVADKSVFGSAKDVVINIVKKAAQVLAKSDNTKDTSQQAADTTLPSRCRSLLQCLPNYELPFRDRVMSLLSCNFSNLLPFLSKNSPWCGWDYCHALFSKHSIGLPWQPEGFYASVFGGPSVLHALCNYHRPLKKETCDALLMSNTSAASANTVLGEEYINISLKSPLVHIGTIPADNTEAQEKVQQEADSQTINEGGTEVKDAATKPETILKGQTEVDQTAQQSGSGDSPQTSTQEGQQPSTPSPQATTPPNVDDSYTMATPQNGNLPQQGSSGQQQQKESVFVRLSNRIKTLERNQSMTASYLEELSRRFKKQNEENYLINEGNKKFVNESRIKFKTLEDLYRFELRSLRRNTEEIRERLFNVQLQRSLLILLCLIQFACLASAVVWVRKRFRQFETLLEGAGHQGPSLGIIPVSSMVSRHTHDSSHHLNVRKRLNSELSCGSGLNSIDKSKKIKKKKKKLSDLIPVNVKVSGPASAPLEITNGKENEFKFKYPTPITSQSVFDIPSSNLKENINPEYVTGIGTTNRSALTPVTTPIPIGSGAPILSTKVDSPFSMISSTSTNFFVDSGVSTSSRFAILASPGPSTMPKATNLRRSGSLTSLGSSSTSSYSYGGKTGGSTGIQSLMNGHGDSQSQGSNNGKKRKNKGLKALMPKIFDR